MMDFPVSLNRPPCAAGHVLILANSKGSAVFTDELLLGEDSCGCRRVDAGGKRHGSRKT
jgi:hypothetical protein